MGTAEQNQQQQEWIKWRSRRSSAGERERSKRKQRRTRRRHGQLGRSEWMSTVVGVLLRHRWQRQLRSSSRHSVECVQPWLKRTIRVHACSCRPHARKSCLKVPRRKRNKTARVYVRKGGGDR